LESALVDLGEKIDDVSKSSKELGDLRKMNKDAAGSTFTYG